MILILGDSNYRNTIETYKESLEKSISDDIIFEFVTSNESLRLALQDREDNPSIVIFGSPLNEVSLKVKSDKKKGRDETLRVVLDEQSNIISESARQNTSCLHLVMPPFLRQEPDWIEKRMKLASFYTNDHVSVKAIPNTAVGSNVEILPEDLEADKLHHNATGKEKLYGVIEADITKIKQVMVANEDDQNAMQWCFQMSNSSTAQTPSTLRKRTRIESEEDASEEDTGKKSRSYSIMSKLDSLISEIRNDRGENKEKFLKVETKVNDLAGVVSEVREQMEELETRAESEDLLTAEMREDIDGLENENLKSIVIIRKLPAASPVPKDKKVLKTYILETAKAIVADILGDDFINEIKFSSTLYATIDPTKKDNREGLIPPFKIGFKTKDMGIKFRELAVKKAKEEGSHLASTYFTHCQSSATRIRVQLMWAVADAIKSKTKEVWVNQVACKPTLQVKEGGRIVKSLGYIKTMQEYGNKIPKKTIEETTKTAKKFFTGKLEKTFVILKD